MSLYLHQCNLREFRNVQPPRMPIKERSGNVQIFQSGRGPKHFVKIQLSKALKST